MSTNEFRKNQIPVISLRAAIESGDRNNVVDKIRQACIKPGFFYISDHGVAQNLIDDLLVTAKQFFSRSMKRKMNISLDTTIRGYLPLGYKSYENEEREGVSHQEGFWMGYETAVDQSRLLDGPNRWPDELPAFKQGMQDYLSAMSGVADVLIELFANALGYDPAVLANDFSNPTSRLKINHYPAADLVEENMGVVPHTDSGAFTILWQDNSGGLEIMGEQGRWLGAPPIDNTFVVNLGNIMQIWSDEKFASTPHRVINRPGVNRFSIPFFVNPDQDALIRPLIGSDTKSAKVFRYGDYQLDLWRKTFPVANIPDERKP